MRFPVNQVSLTNNSEGERESKAEDESKLTEKEGLGSSPLFASFTVSTYIVVSLFAVPRSGHTEHTGFPFVPTYAELKCEKLIVLRSVKAYTMNAVLTVNCFGYHFKFNSSKSMN